MRPSKLFSILRTSDKRLLARSCWQSLRKRHLTPSVEASLCAAYEWVCTAQDAAGDGGVAAWYDLLRGWAASYPETTGYLIPTLLTYAACAGDARAKERALRMADWEIEVQLPSGAVRSGFMSAETVAPAVFNTGQVLFGWAAAYRASGAPRYEQAVRRAAEWLVRVQDKDGAWRRELSAITTSSVQTYNVRSAWALAIVGELFQEPRWTEAACRNAEWALAQRQPNGWFEHNSFADDEIPLLHTIAYTLEGFLGLGLLLGREEFIQAAKRGIEPIVARYEERGRLAGRYGAQWEEAVPWRCLTGEAQTALVLLRLAKHWGISERFEAVANAILQDVAGTQDIGVEDSEVRGAVAGSDPVWGGYCSLRYVNWAVKFYMDALLLKLYGVDVESAQQRGSQEPSHAKNLLEKEKVFGV